MARFEEDAALAATADFGAGSTNDLSRAKHIVFVDRASQALLNLLDRIAPSDANVHIAGETGTGKELVARYVHRKSGRSGPFLAVNCGAISEHLAESELFGHETGAFTGAHAMRHGWFEAADDGTLFLDEIGDLPLSLQGKLLRVLQEGEVSRIGSRKSIPINVRVISASNVDLNAAVDAGNFRLDLLYRLNIVPVQLPPLRERPGDIEALADHFITSYSRRLKRPAPTIRHDALAILQRYAWPGNIRELENVIHFSLLIAPEHEIRPEHLHGLGQRQAATLSPPVSDALDHRALERVGKALRECFATPGNSLLRDVERRFIQDAYLYCDSNQVRTAELLGISRNVVRTLLKRHGLISDAEASLGVSPDLEESSVHSEFADKAPEL